MPDPSLDTLILPGTPGHSLGYLSPTQGPRHPRKGAAALGSLWIRRLLISQSVKIVWIQIMLLSNNDLVPVYSLVGNIREKAIDFFWLNIRGFLAQKWRNAPLGQALSCSNILWYRAFPPPNPPWSNMIFCMTPLPPSWDHEIFEQPLTSKWLHKTF